MRLLRLVLGYGFAPAFFLGFIGAALHLVEAGAPRWNLWLLLPAAILVSLAAERVRPYEREWNRDHGDTLTNILHAVVNEASVVVAVLALPFIAAHLPGLGLWPHDWPLWGQLALAVLVADAGISLVHWASHRVGWLWRFHAVHHAAPRLYGFNGLMKHPVHQALELSAGTLPLVLLGVGTDVAWLLGFAVAIQLLLQHSNVDMRVGPLGYLWAVAPAHRHHHVASASLGNVNFGLFTSLWDHLLGTFVRHRAPPRAGELGIDGEPDFPRGYGHHLLAPFRRRRAGTGPA